MIRYSLPNFIRCLTTNYLQCVLQNFDRIIHMTSSLVLPAIQKVFFFHFLSISNYCMPISECVINISVISLKAEDCGGICFLGGVGFMRWVCRRQVISLEWFMMRALYLVHITLSTVLVSVRF